ncbi:hypothetical protein AAFF_G00428290 [Aldrovandia affinis]|uniref:SH2 domain-containing protein n=1 Tax=Aldrovandia affinis TaxID=143900 RepID=A0AAD7S956_9TELE|nr:hypothetical protein AAFF_G00428290 [Aldrovandia affinis]
MSRREAESLLTDSGDFLVRESGSSPGQYVLSGLQGDRAKHLLLVDPEGMMRERAQPVTLKESRRVMSEARGNGGPLKEADFGQMGRVWALQPDRVLQGQGGAVDRGQRASSLN